MKNLIDELHNLDEYEYKVSSDFSKKVMKEIKKNKNTNKISNVISLASFGAAACLAVVVFANSNLIGRFGAKNESADSINQSELNMAYYDSLGNYATNDSEMKIQEEVIEMDFGNLVAPEAASTNSVINDKIEYTDDLEVEKDSSTKENITNTARGEKIKDYNEILKVLNQADVEAEIIDNGIKAKATKEKIEDLLKNYNNITVEEEGEYAIIK